MTAAVDLNRALRRFDARSFVQRHGGYKESLADHSSEWLLVCPGCASSRLRWNSVKGTWICWGHPRTAPNRSGDTIELIQLLEGCDEGQAIKIVLDNYVGGDSPIARLAGGLRAPRTGLRVLPEIPWPAGVDRLTTPCGPHRVAWDYLAERGLTAADVAAYQIGFGRSGRYLNYIVFPIRMDHAIVYYQGRACWDVPAGSPEERKLWVARTGYRKTLNPSVSESSPYATGREVLFGYDLARQYRSIVICEGPIDAIKVGPNAMALMGKVGQEEKLARLRRLQVESFIIYLDRGAEERECAESIARELASYAPCWIATPPEGRDAGDLTREQNAEVIGRAEPWVPDRLKSGLI